MGSLYANAICTISATASSSSDGGCFYPKKSFADATICILRKQGNMSLVVRSTTSDSASLDVLFDKYVEDGALTGRAWAF